LKKIYHANDAKFLSNIINPIYEDNFPYLNQLVSMGVLKNNAIIACIPAYNEEVSIASVVLKTNFFVDRVFVINDGSLDDTNKLAIASGAIVIDHKNNKGYGGALKTCFKVAKTINAKFMIILDGDGQHDPKFVPLFLNSFKNGADVIVGSRFLQKEHSSKIPQYRKFGMKILNMGTDLTTGGKNSDSQSGYRGYSKKAISSINIFSDKMSAGSEILINAIEHNLNIQEVPIETRYDVKKPKQNAFVHGFNVFKDIVSFIGYKRPLMLFGLLGSILCTIGIIFSIHAILLYNTSNTFPIGTAFTGAVFLIIGSNAIISGLILNSLVQIVNRNGKT